MKTRVARKLFKAIGTEREAAYSHGQLQKACALHRRLKSTRELNERFDALLRRLLPNTPRSSP